MKNASWDYRPQSHPVRPNSIAPRLGADARLGTNRGLTAGLEVLVFQDFRRGVIANEWSDQSDPGLDLLLGPLARPFEFFGKPDWPEGSFGATCRKFFRVACQTEA
jgi:hypothetical protein